MIEEEERDFKTWLHGKQYTILLAIICACFPIVFETYINTDIDIAKNSPHIVEIAYCLGNIIFIMVGIYLLSKNNFLLNNDNGDKGRRLSHYVKDKFGSNSSLYIEGEDDLFLRMEKSFSQFYYSWLIVWSSWLIMYVSKFIFILCSDFSANYFQQYENLLENILNLINSFAIFFTYMVITISTINRKLPGHSLKQMNWNIIVLSFIGICCIITDFSSIFFTSMDQYYKFQFIVQIFISFIACMSMMAVLGRLNSSYLDIPQWLIISLYFYAALQMLHPFELLNAWLKSRSGYLTFMIPRISSVTLNIEQNGSLVQLLDVLSKGIYFIALLGKICLFFTILWVMQKKRFLFFLIHKAHTLTESDDMLVEFNRYYEKYR